MCTVFTYRPNFEVLYANKACARLFGVPAAKLIGADLTQLISATDSEMLKQHIRLLTRENPVSTFTQKIESSGSTFWRQWTHLAIYNEQGSLVMYQTLCLSDHGGESRYRAVVENQAELVCRYTPECVLTFCNEAYCSHFGQDRQQMIGRDILQEIQPEDREELRDYIRRVTRAQPNTTRIQRITNSRGEKLWLEWRRRAFFDDQNRLVEIQAVGRDITDLKNVEEALRASEQALRNKNLELERKNIALEEVLNHIERQKQEIKEDIIANVDNSLLPILDRFRVSTIDAAAVVYIDLLEKSLNQIASSFGRRVTRESLGLSQKEIEIANLISNGLTSKEIANLLHISTNTVGRHRNNIRRKARITNEKVNLSTFLRNM